jgi:hypothetical protein
VLRRVIIHNRSQQLLRLAGVSGIEPRHTCNETQNLQFWPRALSENLEAELDWRRVGYLQQLVIATTQKYIWEDLAIEFSTGAF